MVSLTLEESAKSLVYMYIYYNTTNNLVARKRLEVLIEVICEIQELLSQS
jgi:hypothetical protein